MCGRFSEHVVSMNDWMDALADWARESRLRRNVAPTQSVGAVTPEGCFEMRWGLVPAWSKTPTTQYATFNARFENIAEKPAFRDAWRKSRRCLIPSGGYYEWQTVAGQKQPWFICRPDGGPVVFAGLWEAWTDRASGEVSLSCTVLTKPPTGKLADVHHRMPVMLGREDAEAWLTGTVGDAQSLAEAASDRAVYFYRVSTRVNNARVDDPSLTKPVEA